jgi:hypothetical protein
MVEMGGTGLEPVTPQLVDFIPDQFDAGVWLVMG